MEMFRGMNALLLAASAALVACGGTDESTTGSTGANAVDPNATGTSHVAAEGSTARVLFEDVTDRSRLSVFELEAGTLGVQMAAPIGEELPQHDSLVALYAAIHPGEAAPALLFELDERIAKLLEQVEPRELDQATNAEEPTLGTNDKDANGFMTQVCRTFVEAWRWVPDTCPWGINTKVNYGFRLLNGDRAYGWNNWKWNAHVNWFGNKLTPRGVGEEHVFTIPPYWWTWTSVTSQNSTMFRAAIEDNNGRGHPTMPGDMIEYGLTHHMRVFIPPK